MATSKAHTVAVPIPPFFSQGACLNSDPDLFFEDADEDADQPNPTVVTICNRCPIQVDCLNWAMETDQRHGSWGGTTPRQRRKIRTPIMRSSCPGCFGTNILEEPTVETCLGCGLSWKI